MADEVVSVVLGNARQGVLERQEVENANLRAENEALKKELIEIQYQNKKQRILLSTEGLRNVALTWEALTRRSDIHEAERHVGELFEVLGVERFGLEREMKGTGEWERFCSEASRR